MSLIKPIEIYPATDTPWSVRREFVATAAIVKNDIVLLDSVSGVIPKAGPASSADLASGGGGDLYVSLYAVALGGKGEMVPWRIISSVDTSAAAAKDPVYLGTGGDWSLSPGAEPRVIGTVLSVDATAGKIALEPGKVYNRATVQSEVLSHEFMDDFFELSTAWTVTEDDAACTQAVGDIQFGAVTLTNKASTDNNAQQIQFAQETFILVSGKRIWFEARIRCAAGSELQLDFFVGLAAAEDLTGVADNMPANGIGFHKEDGDAIIDVSSSDGGTNLQSANVGTLADNTWTVLKFVFDGGATGAATITPYVNGTAGTAIASVTYATMAEVAPIIMIRNGDATTTQKMEVDYVRVIQER